MLRPEQGPVIPGSAGLRKLRRAGPGTGIRGGLREIYDWAPAEAAFYMLYVYSKHEQGDLNPVQVRKLAGLVREELK